MGYSIHQRANDFHIMSANQAGALAVLKAWAATQEHIAWVENATVLKARYLEDAMAEFGWEIELDADDNVARIEFVRSSIGEEDKLFAALAPFVEPGSFIEAQGEDGERWRWMFDGQTCREVQAQIVWPSL